MTSSGGSSGDYHWPVSSTLLIQTFPNSQPPAKSSGSSNLTFCSYVDEDQSVRGRESRNVVVAELVASLLQAMVVELGDQAGAKREGRGGVAAHGRAMVWPGA